MGKTYKVVLTYEVVGDNETNVIKKVVSYQTSFAYQLVQDASKEPEVKRVGVDIVELKE